MNEQNRRAFLRRLAALGPMIMTAPAEDVPVCEGRPLAGAPLPPIGEIRRGEDGVLRATIVVDDELRALWAPQPNTRSSPGFRTPACREKQAMRFFAGGPTGGPRTWPAAKGTPSPAPTLRARVGDQVQITLLNHVDVKNFPDSLDLAERGLSTGCDSSSTLAGAPGRRSRQEVYPMRDEMPNCFHGSSSANLHFHGFHISPSGVQDNVLVQVRPSPRDPKTNRPLVTDAAVKRAFQAVFDAAAHGKYPEKWEDLPLEFRRMQEQLVKAYDRQVPTAKLWEANQKAIQSGLWPPFFVGAYPNTFRIIEAGKPIGHGLPSARAGQAPGLHWYHSHKHGSTALNSFNGMAGAFVVEGDYDERLRAFYAGRLDEKIMVMQQYSPVLNLLNAPPPNGTNDVSTFDPPVYINGQLKPVIEMRPGQVQFWRMLNACGQQTIKFRGMQNVDPKGPAIEWRQTAQDGIQYHWANFSADANKNSGRVFWPATRADFLVRAPETPGRYEFNVTFHPFPGSRRITSILTIVVAGEPVSPAMKFPEAEADFPALPAFLADIDPKRIKLRREVTFDTTSFNGDGAPAPLVGRGPYPRTLPARHTIDGAPFASEVINQVMVEGTEEEWTLVNTTKTIQFLGPDQKPIRDAQGRVVPLGEFEHPFHIHINPFQVVEYFDPITMDKPQSFASNAIWHDTIGVPPAYNYFADGKTPRTGPDGQQIYVPGYVKIRTRFDDFTGLFVFHCHILAHEDRGMMQLVQIVPGRTAAGHHH